MVENSNESDASKYGYEDADAAVPASKFSRAPRRSSMKTEGRPRRASIQFGGEIEVTLPGESLPVTRRTSIEFVTKPEVQEVKPQEATHNLWMQQEEYDTIGKNNSKIVSKVEQGTDKHFCLRGLEGMMSTSTQEKYRKDARDSVAEEQSHQRKQGIFDEERISENYKYASLQSKLVAAERGETDNAEIETYLRSTRKMMRRMSM
jgi:hypothetical protein